MAKNGPTERYFRAQDIVAFKRAAKLFKVFIAVRRINPASLAYAGVQGYTAKLIDCKAKTAESDVMIGGKLRKTAGLVVDCDVLGERLAEVFGATKMASAKKEWGKFAHPERGRSLLAPKSLYGPDGRSTTISYNHGFTYFTEMNPDSEHYGCLKHSPTGSTRGGKYVHGDYDLYAVVSADNPAANVFVSGRAADNSPEARMGQDHSRSIDQLNVAAYLSGHMPGMVCHGEQDTFKTDLDDELDVFYPDGVTVVPVLGAQEIARLYATTFKGRPMLGPNSKIVPAPQGGLWKTIQT